jgi:hypothetical protein
MNVVVARHQPTIPVWAWISAVLAFLLFFSVVWWASSITAPEGTINSRPTVNDPEPGPVPPPETQLPPANVFVQPPVMDYSQSPQSPLQGQGYVLPSPPKAVHKAEPKSKPEKIKIEVGKPQSESVVPPPVRIRPPKQEKVHAAAPSVELPARFVYNGSLWVLASSNVINSDEADLERVGTGPDEKGVYTLSGESAEPSVLFMETSPDSGQYNEYRPVDSAG